MGHGEVVYLACPLEAIYGSLVDILAAGAADSLSNYLLLSYIPGTLSRTNTRARHRLLEQDVHVCDDRRITASLLFGARFV